MTGRRFDLDTVSRRRVLKTGGAAIAGAMALPRWSEAQGAPKRGGTLRVSNGGDPPDFDVQRSIRNNPTSLMQERMQRSLSVAGTFGALLELKQFLEALPGRLNRVLDAISTNDLKLKMEVIDEGALIEGFQKIANRITLGLLLASLIVGAALLMRVTTSFTILGYPGLAMMFFLLAAAGGIWLAVSILTGDRPQRHERVSS